MTREVRWLLALLAIGVLAVLAVCALMPVPMTPQASYWRGNGVEEQRLPGTSVTVRVVAGGISIDADDGGGAGMVAAPNVRNCPCEIAIYAHDRAFDVVLSDRSEGAMTVVNADGVRLDDSLTDRIGGRIGWGSGITLFLALVLILVRAARGRRRSSR